MVLLGVAMPWLRRAIASDDRDIRNDMAAAVPTVSQ
jgi:hypothetical protein